MEIRFDTIPEEQIVVDMEKHLKDDLIYEDVKKLTRNGKTIIVEGKVPKRLVKFIVKKYLGRSAYKNQTKIIANGNIFNVIMNEASS